MLPVVSFGIKDYDIVPANLPCKLYYRNVKSENSFDKMLS